MSNEQQRGIQIKSDNGIVYLPSDATAEEINELAKIEMGKQMEKMKPIAVEVTEHQPIELKKGEPIPFDLMVAVEKLSKWVLTQPSPLDASFDASFHQSINMIAKRLNYTVDTVERAYKSVFNYNMPMVNYYENSVTYPLHTKPKKPNTGLKLGSYVYKSKRK